MIYILLSILFSSLLFVIFKLFGRFKVDALQAIIFNYLTACIVGFSVYGQPLSLVKLSSFSWFYYSLALGLVFISVFYFMAITTQKNGLSVVAVASKMSVVIPIMVGVFLYNESIGRLKVAGIVIALISIYLVTVNPNKIKASTLFFPLLVFAGSGLIDVSLKYLQTNFVKPSDISVFSATLFGTAGFAGLLIFALQLFQGTFKLQFKSLLGGIILGVANYFSIYFLIKAIAFKGLESSTFFIINNVGILFVTSLLGVLLFREKLTPQNRFGILLAVSGIVLVSLSSRF